MTNPITYPPEFLERMHQQLGDEYAPFIQSLDTPSPTSVRLNREKRISKFDADEKIPWCDEGRYLTERPSFTFDPLFHAGTYYVQEASSMFIEQVWKQVNPENERVKVLDLCAAPGGKSTHLLSLMTEDSLLVSNEIIANRNKVLQQNIVKWGYANCIITQNKTQDFAAIENYFDLVLVDAPCSGEGLFRKDKDAIDEWSEKNVAACSIRQKQILQHAFACLKPGGYLIYSTCTYEPVENDENLKWLLQFSAETIKLNLFPYNGQIISTDYGCQFYPHKIKGEGFYIGVLKKYGDAGSTSHSVRTNASLSPQKLLQSYLQLAENFAFHLKNDMTFAIPQSMSADFHYLEKQLYIRHAGIFMGLQKGKDFLPSHDLALSNYIRPDLPAIVLNFEEAIAYMRCETVKSGGQAPGWYLIRFEGFNLGWVKVLQGRINNYFPKDWRILKRD